MKKDKMKKLFNSKLLMNGEKKVEDLSEIKTFHYKNKKRNEKDFDENESESEIGMIASIIYNEEENRENENDKNNYYNIGMDVHNDLEDDKEN